MKFLPAAILLLGAQDAGIKFGKDFEEALKTAKEKRLPVLLVFSQDTWGYCRKMEEETFSDGEVAEFCNKNLACVELDPRKNKELAEKFKMELTPSAFLVDPDGELLSAKAGYFKKSEYATWLKRSLPAAMRVIELKGKLGDKPEDCVAYKEAGDAYHCLGTDSKALERFAKALELNEKRPANDLSQRFKGETLAAKGLTHFRKADPAGTFGSIGKALLEMDAEGKLGLRDNGLMLKVLSAGMDEKEGQLLEQLITQMPVSDCMDGLLWIKGYYLAEVKKDREAALKVLKGALEKYPESIFRYNVQDKIKQLEGK